MWIGIIFIVIIVLSIIAKILSFRCTECKKFFAKVLIEKKEVKSERISKMENHYSYDKHGKRTGYREVRVYGKRKTYSYTYRCQYCGAITVELKHEDKY